MVAQADACANMGLTVQTNILVTQTLWDF